MMKAIQYTQYGSANVLNVTELEMPVPRPNEILVKVRAASVTRADTMMRKGQPMIGRLMLGLTKPKYPGVGTGFSGEIVALGDRVTQFQVGDQIMGESIFGSGTNAEFVCVSEDGIIAKKPSNLSHEEACSLCDGPITSMNFLRDVAQLKTGQKILIYGASGSLGSAAVQIAKQLGANVTAVCSGANAIWVKSLGADRVIDYLKEDYRMDKSKYAVIFDTIGLQGYWRARKSLTHDGVYLSPVLNAGIISHMLLTSIFTARKAKFSATGLRAAHELRGILHELKELFGANKMQTVIDRRYPLEQAANAHAYVDTGHKKGNVVLLP